MPVSYYEIEAKFSGVAAFWAQKLGLKILLKVSSVQTFVVNQS